jgi:arylsulfatase A-like enzyme
MKSISLFSLFLAVFSSAIASQPNVILIVTDDQGYGDMSVHGNPWLDTPNLDRLHNEGISLDDYHVDPYCTPTRAALMTGRYSVRVGAWAVTEGRQLLNPDETTMAEVFAASGYRTGMFGKWHLGDAYPYAPRYRGFQDTVHHLAGGVDEIGNPVGNDYFDDTYYRDGVAEKFEGYCTDVFFDETLRFIEEGRASDFEQPFFIYLPLNAMHGPLTVDPSYSDPFMAQGLHESLSKFLGMVQNFDENLGRLLESLKEWGIDENTIIVFMGDNGTGGGYDPKTGQGYNAGMRDKKGSTYEGGHRVACFIRWRGKFEGGKSVETLTAHLDWLPTFVELCDLKTPVDLNFDGENIAGLLRGEANNGRDRILFVDRQADQLEKWHLGADLKAKYPSRAVLTERWRLVNSELYDIVQDPGQRTNVAKQFPEVVENLDQAYGQHFRDVTSHGGKYTPFFIGSSEENPTRFTTRDWHHTKGGVIWKMELVENDSLFVNGFWALDAQQAGRYRIRLSRYPKDAEKPIGANKARIRIGEYAEEKNLQPKDAFVNFEMELPKGETLLQTWFMDAETQQERGAYYVWVEYLGK